MFPEVGLSAHARLLRDEAPRTCEAVVRGPPFECETSHAIYSGPEVLLFVSPGVWAPPGGSRCYFRTTRATVSRPRSGSAHRRL
ncbi:MAG: DUF3830 family protein [Myxococcota bacterium]